MGQYVRVDVQILKSDLNEFQESIYELKKAFEETGLNVESLKSQWTGEAADRFISCFSKETMVYEELIKELELMQERFVMSHKEYCKAKDDLLNLLDDFRV